MQITEIVEEEKQRSNIFECRVARMYRDGSVISNDERYSGGGGGVNLIFRGVNPRLYFLQEKENI